MKAFTAMAIAVVAAALPLQQAATKDLPFRFEQQSAAGKPTIELSDLIYRLLPLRGEALGKPGIRRVPRVISDKDILVRVRINGQIPKTINRPEYKLPPIQERAWIIGADPDGVWVTPSENCVYSPEDTVCRFTAAQALAHPKITRRLVCKGRNLMYPGEPLSNWDVPGRFEIYRVSAPGRRPVLLMYKLQKERPDPNFPIADIYSWANYAVLAELSERKRLCRG